jgi:hypothetical protein
MSDERLSDFILAGGTNLALQIGHRKSYDLDMFPYKPFETAELIEYLKKQYDFQPEMIKERNTIIGYIEGVKVDFVAHIYPPLQEPIIEDGIRLYSLPDIACMKLNATGQNGTRLKDFVDLAYMSMKMSLKEMIDCFVAKYPNTSPFQALKGLAYFNEINFEAKIDLCNGKKFEWKKIEKRISEMFKYETKIFETEPI